jgi:hypothetical protein
MKVAKNQVKIDFRPISKQWWLSTAGFKAMKKGKRTKGVYMLTWIDPLFTTKIHLCIFDTMDVGKAVYKKLTKDEGPDQAIAWAQEWASPNGALNVAIMLPMEATPGVIVHECVHARSFVFKHHGMKLDVENDEAEAYYLEKLVDTCAKAIVHNDSLRDEESKHTKRK